MEPSNIDPTVSQHLRTYAHVQPGDKLGETRKTQMMEVFHRSAGQGVSRALYGSLTHHTKVEDLAKTMKVDISRAKTNFEEKRASLHGYSRAELSQLLKTTQKDIGTLGAARQGMNQLAITYYTEGKPDEADQIRLQSESVRTEALPTARKLRKETAEKLCDVACTELRELAAELNESSSLDFAHLSRFESLLSEFELVQRTHPLETAPMMEAIQTYRDALDPKLTQLEGRLSEKLEGVRSSLDSLTDLGDLERAGEDVSRIQTEVQALATQLSRTSKQANNLDRSATTSQILSKRGQAFRSRTNDLFRSLQSAILTKKRALFSAKERGSLEVRPSRSSKLVKWFVAKDQVWKQQKYSVHLQEQKRNLETSLGASLDHTAARLYSKPTKTPVDESALAYIAEISKEGVDPRTQYYNSLKLLRAGLEAMDPHKPIEEGSAEDFLIRAAGVRYRENQLFTFSESVVDLWKETGKEARGVAGEDEAFITDSDFAQIEAAKELIGAERIAVEKGKARGTFNVGFDPNMQSNVPYVLADVAMLDRSGQPVTRRFLRMGTPTIEGFRSPARITPEFKAYLMDCKRKGERHLYISLQSGIPKTIGDETGRTKAILDLQKTFPDHFQAVVLSQNSEFYKNPGPEGEVRASDFQRAFYNQLIGPLHETGNSFPEQWMGDPAFLRELRDLMGVVHETLYEGKEHLTLDERRDFVETYYALLVPHLANRADANQVNITCKDGIDRAMKTNALFLKSAQVMQGDGTDARSRQMLQKMTHFPAISVKKQPIIHSRRDRLMTALARLNNPRVQERLRTHAQTYNDGINPKASHGIFVEERPDQQLVA